jgi:hypothetical protein
MSYNAASYGVASYNVVSYSVASCNTTSSTTTPQAAPQHRELRCNVCRIGVHHCYKAWIAAVASRCNIATIIGHHVVACHVVRRRITSRCSWRLINVTIGRLFKIIVEHLFDLRSTSIQVHPTTISFCLMFVVILSNNNFVLFDDSFVSSDDNFVSFDVCHHFVQHSWLFRSTSVAISCNVRLTNVHSPFIPVDAPYSSNHMLC